MKIPLSAQCLMIGLLGLFFSMVMVLRSLKAKAKVANVPFSVKNALADDYLSYVGTILVLTMCMFFFGYAQKKETPEVLLLLFATIGYAGNDIASRFFSETNKRINSAIDVKTDIADNTSKKDSAG